MPRKALEKFLEDHPPPESPGVYIFLNSLGEILYVGKSINLRRRLRQYLVKSKQRRDRKRNQIISELASIKTESCFDEKSALLRENQIIRTYKPKYNVADAYSFLYPAIAAKYDAGCLVLIRTTYPELFPGFQLFGAFRNRALTKEMFFCLDKLLSLAFYKRTSKQLKDIPLAPYSRRIGFRRMDQSSWINLQKLFLGESKIFCQDLSLELLSRPRARANASDVTVYLKTLLEFFLKEASPLFRARQKLEIKTEFVEQSMRDRLFIQARFD